MIKQITFTGLDYQTPVLDIENLLNSTSLELVEFGILYKAVPSTSDFRYPDIEAIERISDVLTRVNPTRLSLHICGKPAREKVLNGELDFAIQRFQRIQVNGKLSNEELEDFVFEFPYHEIITQHSAKQNIDLLTAPFDNHSVLLDSSEGRGVKPDKWTIPLELIENGKSFGVAGGIGPENIKEVIASLENTLKLNLEWLDIETNIRDNSDLFDLSLVKKTLAQVDSLLNTGERLVNE